MTDRKLVENQAFQSQVVDTVLEDPLTSHSLARELGSGPEHYPPPPGGSEAQVLEAHQRHVPLVGLCVTVTMTWRSNGFP